MQVNISLSAARPTTNSLGHPIHYSKKGITNFYKWFGRSKVVDDQKRPIVVYHGTNEDFHNIDPTKFGIGNDQHGSGFYTTSINHLASGYAKHDKDYANVKLLYVKIEKPVIPKRKLSYADTYALITKSPNFDTVLQVNYEADYLGKRKATKEAVESYYEYQDDNCIETFNGISNDFWRKLEGQFLACVNEVLGYDGVIIKGDGGDIYVTWFPTQVKSVFNNGNFDPTNNSMVACNEK